ncbi:hypothetical protein ANN_13099 [Periplaneta americana]|uniref:Per a allergen n=1 Tax=Periplaneta americana TaxID=6978 RepID=A0ABQ8TKM1_PERAM|nr:hypothetical protein ANN_13099 [Periplaneta americana]
MAGLCEGGNEPPGSLKANMVIFQEFKFLTADYFPFIHQNDVFWVPITTAGRVLTLRMEETASRYGE